MKNLDIRGYEGIHFTLKGTSLCEYSLFETFYMKVSRGPSSL